MPHIVNAIKSHITLGEINYSFKQVFGNLSATDIILSFSKILGISWMIITIQKYFHRYESIDGYYHPTDSRIFEKLKMISLADKYRILA